MDINLEMELTIRIQILNVHFVLMDKFICSLKQSLNSKAD